MEATNDSPAHDPVFFLAHFRHRNRNILFKYARWSCSRQWSALSAESCSIATQTPTQAHQLPWAVQRQPRLDPSAGGASSSTRSLTRLFVPLILTGQDRAADDFSGNSDRSTRREPFGRLHRGSWSALAGRGRDSSQSKRANIRGFANPNAPRRTGDSDALRT